MPESAYPSADPAGATGATGVTGAAGAAGASAGAGAGIAVVVGRSPGIGNGFGVWTTPVLAHAASEAAKQKTTMTRAITDQYRPLLPNCVVLRDSWHNAA